MYKPGIQYLNIVGNSQCSLSLPVFTFSLLLLWNLSFDRFRTRRVHQLISSGLLPLQLFLYSFLVLDFLNGIRFGYFFLSLAVRIEATAIYEVFGDPEGFSEPGVLFLLRLRDLVSLRHAEIKWKMIFWETDLWDTNSVLKKGYRDIFEEDKKWKFEV